MAQTGTNCSETPESFFLLTILGESLIIWSTVTYLVPFLIVSNYLTACPAENACILTIELLTVPKLHISARKVQSVLPRIPVSISDGAPVQVTTEHMPLLQGFFQFIVGETMGGSSHDTPAPAQMLLDMMGAYCNRQVYTRRKATAAWLGIVHALQHR